MPQHSKVEEGKDKDFGTITMGEHLRGTVLSFSPRLRRGQHILILAAAAAYVVGVGLDLGSRSAIDAAIC